ncbi:MAG: hypothetical protein KGL39_13835 [Patescibacteria group bacterium]|nr:hypothetical protein [Patescibacteria group bacterium]
MTTILSPLLVQKFFDNNGVPLSSGQLYSYQAGTSTLLATYIDSTGATQNANPTILNSRGEADVWIPPNTAYKFVLEDASNDIIWTVDNVIISQLLTLYGGTDTGTANAYIVTFTANFSSLADGIIVYFLPSNTNTGDSTLNVNSTGALPLVNSDGSGLLPGQVVSSHILGAIYRSGSWYLLGPYSAAPVLPRMTVLSSTAVVTDAGGTQQQIGFLGTPINVQNTNYTLVLADSGKTVYTNNSTTVTWTIPANSSVAYPLGTIITLVNDSPVSITLTINSDTLIWVPTGATGSRTIATYGRGVLQKVGATRWWLSGLGIT